MPEKLHSPVERRDIETFIWSLEPPLWRIRLKLTYNKKEEKKPEKTLITSAAKKKKLRNYLSLLLCILL